MTEQEAAGLYVVVYWLTVAAHDRAHADEIAAEIKEAAGGHAAVLQIRGGPLDP